MKCVAVAAAAALGTVKAVEIPDPPACVFDCEMFEHVTTGTIDDCAVSLSWSESECTNDCAPTDLASLAIISDIFCADSRILSSADGSYGSYYGSMDGSYGSMDDEEDLCMDTPDDMLLQYTQGLATSCATLAASKFCSMEGLGSLCPSSCGLDGCGEAPDPCMDTPDELIFALTEGELPSCAMLATVKLCGDSNVNYLCPSTCGLYGCGKAPDPCMDTPDDMLSILTEGQVPSCAVLAAVQLCDDSELNFLCPSTCGLSDCGEAPDPCMDPSDEILSFLTEGEIASCAFLGAAGFCSDAVSMALANGTVLGPLCPTTCGLYGCGEAPDPCMDLTDDLLFSITEGLLASCAAAESLGLCNDDLAKAMSGGSALSPFCPTTCKVEGCYEATVELSMSLELTFTDVLSPEDEATVTNAILQDIIADTGVEADYVMVTMTRVETQARRLLNVAYTVVITITLPEASLATTEGMAEFEGITETLIEKTETLSSIEEIVNVNGGVEPEVTTAPVLSIEADNLSDSITLSESPTAYPTAYPTVSPEVISSSPTPSPTSEPTAPPTTFNSATKNSMVFGLLVSFICVAFVV